jgi:hypothetical protein
MPLGWYISVSRQQDNGSTPAEFLSAKGTLLAAWQAHVEGLGWIYELVEQQKATHLGGDGYPYRLTATAEHVITRIRDGKPPAANPVWRFDEGDILYPNLPGKTIVDLPAMDACRAEEWLLIEAWDES